MNILIVTGGSKGIGKALAEKYASENYKVYSLSRSIIDIQNVTQIAIDLTDLNATKKSFKMLLDEISKEETSSLTLINNAGRIGKIANLENLEAEDIAKIIQLNTTIPAVLSALFIKHFEKLTCKKQIINISSGASVNAYQGWATYCTSKAGINMLTKAIATEQSVLENGVKCVSIFPGVVDTNMQTQIRRTAEEDFKSLERFVALKENNQLYTPNFVAESIFTIDTENKLSSGDIVDIRSF